MKYLRTAAAAILLFALVIRTAAAVIAPAVPLLVVAFAIAAVLTLVLGGRR
jgi:hypothetical protein